MKRILRYFRCNEYNEDYDKTHYHVLDAISKDIETVEELESEVDFYHKNGFVIEAINTSFITARKFCFSPLDLFEYKNDFELVL